MKLLLAGALSLLASIPDARSTSAQDVLAAFADLASRPVWPGFEPRSIPRAVFDGEATWLQDHPRAVEGFVAVADRPGLARSAGRHEAMRANSSAEIGGVATATLLLDPASARTAAEWAAILVHESFHVFQRREHADWWPDE